jgi:PAS domain S-box-containing protein
MSQKIKILHLEDVLTDAELVSKKLKTKLSFESHLVNSKQAFENALINFVPDVILCDHSLPAFNSIEALRIVREKGLSIPFILVTGAVSEEFAVNIIHLGADDYILKDRLERLPNAIISCLDKYNAEKKRKEIEERFVLTLNSLKDYAIFQLDANGDVASWNTGAQTIKGFDESQILGKTSASFYTEADTAKGIPEYNLRMAREMRCFQTNGWRRRKDGSLFFAEVLINALYDGQNKLKGYAKVVRDVTERKDAEEKIKKSESDLRNHFDRSLDVICSTDEEGRFTGVSAAALSVLGYQPDSLIGTTYMDLVVADDVKRTLKAAEYIRTGQDVTTFENRLRRKDGSIVNLQWSSHWDGNDKMMYSIARDVTEKKNAERETLSLLNRIQAKNKDLRQFAYMVSHNLRAPIAKIIGMVSIAQTSSDSTMLQKINEEAIRLDNVVKDMNTIIAAKEADKEKVESILFEEELTLVKRILEQEILESHAVIITNFHIAGMLTVKGRFYNILFNLISNAVKYRSPDRSLQINVDLTESDNYFCLSVKDNGLGINLDKYSEHMFMLYKRFHGNDIPGKGIGLNLVKGQVESLGGHIDVDSTVNEGSTFKVHFPKNYKSKISLQIDRIYLIDDDALCNAISKRVILKQLSVSEINVYERATAGLAALKEISPLKPEQFPDLIFLDLDMPMMDGWQFLEEFEALPAVLVSKCKVIIITSSIDPEEIERSKHFKTVHSFISKPLTQQKVLELVS